MCNQRRGGGSCRNPVAVSISHANIEVPNLVSALRMTLSFMNFRSSLLLYRFEPLLANSNLSFVSFIHARCLFEPLCTCVWYGRKRWKTLSGFHWKQKRLGGNFLHLARFKVTDMFFDLESHFIPIDPQPLPVVQLKGDFDFVVIISVASFSGIQNFKAAYFLKHVWVWNYMFINWLNGLPGTVTNW